ncbi:glycoside hydrolase family 16 protein [Wenyingzhuangia sp. chi5]|uniref:Glycoside hydrolase family 16 protein n=1 Tax=Wenyingzhuangia gilva TaxID=3057677 RepID=A0ABT8VU65_9FLAO|nr:glycoside hydrolase family 16 protein [Wenyingzhuangia sp. chi5]MDO3695520.1 glycoside hydrolase family 16 protein [Wenyingzhuangia sp. chi5]
MNESLLYSCLLFLTISAYSQEKIIFDDDFNKSELDTTYWSYDLGDGCPNLCGWGNEESQWYQKENIKVKDGFLHIKASKKEQQYFSGKITTKDKISFQYGTIEVRAKVPNGKGLWPAAWLLGSDISEVGWPACGEIDMLEYLGRDPNYLYTSLHTPASHGETINTKRTFVEAIDKGFHTYKTIWTKEAISFYVDDLLLYTFSPEIKNDQTWPYDKPFYLILNLAIGGNFGGKEIDDTALPQEFVVDYIKVTQ